MLIPESCYYGKYFTKVGANSSAISLRDNLNSMNANLIPEIKKDYKNEPSLIFGLHLKETKKGKRIFKNCRWLTLPYLPL